MINIARKPFNTPIEEEISTKFKEKCKENGLKMNEVLEAVMDAYIKDEFKIKTSYNIEMKTN